MNNTHKKTTLKSGFTLIEIMVSISIFTIIITVGMGALVSIVNSYRISQEEKEVHNDLNSVIETITREIRTGKNYYSGANSNGSNQGSFNDNEASSLGFDTSDGRGYVVYYKSGDSLMINRIGATNAQNGIQSITDSSKVIVDEVRFTVIGTDPLSSGNTQQPLVWFQIKAHATGGDVNRETTVQSFISQRSLDA